MEHIVFWIGATADFWTTRVGLDAGFKEGNPLVRYILEKLPYDSEVELAWLKVLVYSIVVLIGAPAWVLYALGILQVLVAARNYRLLRKARVL